MRLRLSDMIWLIDIVDNIVIILFKLRKSVTWCKNLCSNTNRIIILIILVAVVTTLLSVTAGLLTA